MEQVVLAGLGDLNSRVAARAIEQGQKVVAFRRNIDSENTQVHQVAIDLSQQLWPDYKADLLVVALSAQTRSLAGYQQAYAAPIEKLIESLPAWSALPKKIIVVSSSRVFGEDKGGRVTEDTPAQSSDPYAKILIEMEQRLHSIDTDTCAATLSGIYSEQRDWLKRQAYKPASELPQSNHWTNRIHINDAARALMHLIQLEQALPKRVLVTDTQPMPMYEVLNFLRQQAGLPQIEPTPPVAGGKRLTPEFLLNSGFNWQFPTAMSGGYSQA